MSKRISAWLLCLAAFSLPSMAAQANSIVSEDIFIYLQAGPSTQYRILGSVRAGEALVDLKERQNDYAKVRDEQGRTGWIKVEYLKSGPSFRTRVPQLEKALADTRQQLATITEERDALLGNSQEQRSTIQNATQQVDQLSADNERLQQEVTKLKNNERFIWLTQGGILAGAGLLVGFIIAYLPRPKRRRRNDQWV
ncbi:TIGR04211 family SH3 domain-containing protein [Ferrimonas gelatinilytica]|uniref:TIGR04211 family SH3 domain-containing protein n=1 Tax=Ferrimonas gelatinilytica TaxID=1255257 RepID=A0ABP9S9E9_9GAMM